MTLLLNITSIRAARVRALVISILAAYLVHMQILLIQETSQLLQVNRNQTDQVYSAFPNHRILHRILVDTLWVQLDKTVREVLI